MLVVYTLRMPLTGNSILSLSQKLLLILSQGFPYDGYSSRREIPFGCGASVHVLGYTPNASFAYFHLYIQPPLPRCDVLYERADVKCRSVWHCSATPKSLSPQSVWDPSNTRLSLVISIITVYIRADMPPIQGRRTNEVICSPSLVLTNPVI